VIVKRLTMLRSALWALAISATGGGVTVLPADGQQANDIPARETDPQFTVQVNRDTGEVTLFSDEFLPVGTQGYSLTSVSGALIADNWSSIAETADANSGGSFDPTAVWVRFTASGATGDLSEGVLGSTTIVPGKEHNFGHAWTLYPFEDLVLTVLDAQGNVQAGNLEFVGNGGQPYMLGDLNFDNLLNELDWLEFLHGLGGEFPNLSPAQSYAWGDLTGDLETDRDDFLAFQDAFDVVNGPGAFQDMLRSLPEPSCSLLLFLLIPARQWSCLKR
jgi:hypothetical protein